MIIGIDASNIRAGGGVTHLVELLRAADPDTHGFYKVIVWGGKTTLGRIEDRSWLVKSHQPLLDKNLPHRTFWQRFRLSNLVRAAGCDVLFIPGGSYAGDFQPIVTMSQNLLPFEWREMLRYGWSWYTLRLLLLRWAQSRTFRRSDGLMFLTQYAQEAVMRVLGIVTVKTKIVPHGIDKRFISAPREQHPIDNYSVERPFRILYVSIIDQYKHQWHVVEAVRQLRERGLPVVLELVGPAYQPSLNRLQNVLERLDPLSDFIHYSGLVPYTELHTCYTEADVFLFASSCETFGLILTEAMSAGLPIACSNRSAMFELLGDAGVYFDPEQPADIANILEKLLVNPDMRYRLACASFAKVQIYSWERCAKETFSFLAQVVDH